MPATLLDLPTEVLYLIIGNFRLLRPRQPIPHPPGQNCQALESAPSDRQSLVSLIATCRQLRNLVQPLLYHTAYPCIAQVEFARTLKDRPDLAAQVRELYYTSNAHEDRSYRPLYTEPVNTHARYPRESPDKGNFNELAAEHPQGLYAGDLWENEKGKICGKDYIGLLDHLSLNLHDVWDIKQRILERNLLVQTLQMTSFLEKLILWYEPTDIKQLPPGILPLVRQVKWFSPDFWWTGTDRTIEGFPEAMPNLQILDCHFNTRLITDKSSTITDLNLNYCYLQRGDFDKIAAGFINLRKLSYHVSPGTDDGDFGVCARGVCEALYPRRHTLQDLSIWMDRWFSRSPAVDMNPQVPLEDDVAPETCFLSKLTSLERLSLNHDSICDLRKGLSNDTQIGELFPPSLRYIEFCLGRAGIANVGPYLEWMSRNTNLSPLVIICHHSPKAEPEMAELFRALGATYAWTEKCNRDEDKL